MRHRSESPAAPDVPAASNAARKRPGSPLPPPPPPPPAKRERRTSPPPRRPLADTARDAWDALCARHPARKDFLLAELLAEAEAEWAGCCATEKRVMGWRREFGKFVKKERGMFRKGVGEGVLMANRGYGAAGGRKKGLKKAEAEAEVVVDAASAIAVGPTVPAEWRGAGVKPVRLSTFDRSSGISFGEMGEVKGKKGYRMVRATAGVVEGDWYFECRVGEGEVGNVRVGWSTRRADVETPVGADGYGFAVRDLTGECVHRGRRRAYGEPFGGGDVVGCRIKLPALTDEQRKAVAEADERWLQHKFVKFLQGPPPPDSEVELPSYGAFEFYKNGKSMGVPNFYVLPTPAGTAPAGARERKRPGTAGEEPKAVEEPNRVRGLKAGTYYPSVALFQDASARANFGPDFQFSLPKGARPMCEAAPDPPVAELAPQDKADREGKACDETKAKVDGRAQNAAATGESRPKESSSIGANEIADRGSKSTFAERNKQSSAQKGVLDLFNKADSQFGIIAPKGSSGAEVSNGTLPAGTSES